MFQIAIIGRDFHPDGKETASQIFAGLKNLASDSVNYSLVFLKNITFDISNQLISVKDGVSGRELKEFDAVLMTNWFSHASIRKDLAYSLALYFKSHKIPVFNSEALQSRSTSKLSQMMLAAQHGIAIPRTLFSLSFAHLLALTEPSQLPWPLIFKDAQASRGNSNYLVKNEAEALALQDEHTERHPFIVQETIQSDGSDYRFFITNGKTRFVIHRIGNGDSHLNNTSAGASTKLLQAEDFSTEVQTAVTRAAQMLHREVTGLDIMISTSGQHFFLEANPIPQIATGSNVAKKLAALEAGLIEAAQERGK